MNKIRRTTAAAVGVLVLAAPALTACDWGGPSTCDTFSLSTTAGGKGGKSSTTKTKPKTKSKTGTGSGTGTVHRDDDCDDD